MDMLDPISSGVPPRSLSDIDHAIPADLAALVQRALDRDPARRFASLAEMREQLARIADRLSRS
jgi:hypothetical protein